MKIDVTPVLLGFNGKPIQADNEDGEPVRWTVRKVCCDALLAVRRGDDKLTGEDKAHRFALARRIFEDDSVDFTPEDLALVRKLIGAGFGPAIVGPAWALLDVVDPEPQPEPQKRG